MDRRLFLSVLGVLAVPRALARPERRAVLYKLPGCGCCEDYADYLRGHGITVAVVATRDLDKIREKEGVPEALAGCHTMVIGGYVVEGHVPIGSIERLLGERPKLRGISLPGMPQGSPGMTGRKTMPFTVYQIGLAPGAPRRVFAVH